MVLGYATDEYVGKWVFYQPDGGIDETFKETFSNMASTHQTFFCEMVRKHKKGHEVWLKLKGTPASEAVVASTEEHLAFVVGIFASAQALSILAEE